MGAVAGHEAHVPAREKGPLASLIFGLSYESVAGSSLPTGYGDGDRTAAGTAGRRTGAMISRSSSFLTSMCSTSMFRDTSPDANSAASNNRNERL